MYRDGQRAEIESLRNEASRAEAARAELLREQQALRDELHRLKEGVEPDAGLNHDGSYRRMRGVLLVLTGLASLALMIGLRYVLAWAIEEPLFNAQGLRNFGWSVMHGHGLLGIAATGFIAMMAMPWVVLPTLGRRGLRGDRRWGWLCAVGGAALFVPTPLMPLAVFVLSVLLSKRVRAVYFPAR